MLRLSRLAVAALGLFGFAISASAQTVVADLPLAGGASERVLFASPANPAAILVMLPGGDSCPASPPADAQRIADALTGAPKKEIVFFDSSEIRSAPCQAMSPHGYLGIEPQVVGRVVGWIRAAATP